MNEALYDIVLERILADETLGDAGDVVLAACDGEEALQARLDGVASPTRTRAQSPRSGKRPGVGLASITVEGFRGIGKRVRLAFEPGPGLTIVVGRNGTGKSSFAEALELLLTGKNQRWDERSSVWRDGWRNLHWDAACSVRAEFLVEGQAGPLTVSREWKSEDGLGDARAVVQPHGQPKKELADLGWGEALGNFRPFLSYNELGTMLDKGPSYLHDRLSAILGLGELSQAEGRLREARKTREEGAKRAEEVLTRRIRPLLVSIEDERAVACARALGRRPWKLDEVDAILANEPAGEFRATRLGLLQRLSAVTAPSEEQVQAALEGLRTALEAVRETSQTPAERARRIAALLQQAVELHDRHGDRDCPICGRGEALDASWREATEQEMERLRVLAQRSDEAHEQMRQARRRAAVLLQVADSLLAGAEEVGIDPAPALEALQAWRAGAELERAEDLLAHLEQRYGPLAEALRAFTAAAAAELQRSESAWTPVAIELQAWVRSQREADKSAADVERLKKAEKWLKGATASIRDERFAPIGEVARQNWDILRRNSNVELGRVELSGLGNQRRVVLDVSVDGVAGAALGVMSQGELNSLALSLFLPRATLPESPFRFLVIDDPVQSMDAARVDGLARVLENTAKTRQVIVFTHDARLRESVRRLGIAGRIIEVTRALQSVVEVRPGSDPAGRALADADALLKTEGLDRELAGRLVPGFCRAALEATFTDRVRRQQMAKGVGHDEVEARLAAAMTLNKLAALALFDDATRTGDVQGRLGRHAGAYRACNQGTHQGYDGDLETLYYQTKQLVETLRR